MTRGRRRDGADTSEHASEDASPADGAADVAQLLAENKARAAVKKADRRAGFVIVALAVIGGVAAGYLGEPKSWEHPASSSVPAAVRPQGGP